MRHFSEYCNFAGEPVVYTNWIPGRKSNFQSHNTEDCVAFIPYKQGQWDDIPCGSSSVLFGETGETHPYMCEYSKLNVYEYYTAVELQWLEHLWNHENMFET